MTLQEAILREIESMPEERQAEVLAYVRFLKIGLADKATVEREFDAALAAARQIAAQRGITEADIADEIRAVREGA